MLCALIADDSETLFNILISGYEISRSLIISIENFGNGLINHTFKVVTSDDTYILQRINNEVFQNPYIISNNLDVITDYLHNYHPEYMFVTPIRSSSSQFIVHDTSGYYRLFPFVKNSCTLSTVSTSNQAYEAAYQFSLFASKLSSNTTTNNINNILHEIKDTITNFHNLPLRYNEFLSAIQNGDQTRIQECQDMIKEVLKYSDIVEEYKSCIIISDNNNNSHNIVNNNKSDNNNNMNNNNGSKLKLRIMHHDTKINNVLFDDNNKDKALCIIDYDTIMWGYYISDVGDMLRTYLSPVDENETDMSKIEIRHNIFKAIYQGYMANMGTLLTPTEVQYFYYAGKYMIYMQFIRFLTDYLYNDKYYSINYTAHNKIRALNQLTLLLKYIKDELILKQCTL